MLRLSDSSLYKARYIISYVILGLIFIGTLLFAVWHIPGGLSHDEINSVVTSDSLNLKHLATLTTTDLPYHILQKISLHLFGVTEFSIKLPSLILALAAMIGFVALLAMWYRRGMALLASFVIVSTGQFILIAQTGAPDIMYLLWSIYLLLFGTIITHSRASGHRTLWPKIGFLVTASLSLYTPLSVYVLIAIGVAILTHPHLRCIVSRLKPWSMIVAAACSLLALTPLIILIIMRPSLSLELLGAPGSMPNFGANLLLLTQHYFNFDNSTTISATLITSGLASFAITMIGLIHTIRAHSTATSYTILLWLVLLIVPVIINPNSNNILYTPLAILFAAGLATILRYWYKLFPRNPYARTAGLIPIAILLISLISVGLEHYIDSYRYNPTIVSSYSEDLSLLPHNTKRLVVSRDEFSFYNIVARHRTNLVVREQVGNWHSFTMTRQARLEQLKSHYHVTHIVTNAHYLEADRFYDIILQ